MRKVGLDETQAGIKIAERNSNNLTYDWVVYFSGIELHKLLVYF